MRLGESGDNLIHGLAYAREERDLKLGIAARFRGSQPTDKVNDAIEAVRFEREYPFVIADPERTSRIGEDIGKLSAGEAVVSCLLYTSPSPRDRS